MEYRCTRLDTPVTTTSITAVMVSTRTVQSTEKSPDWIQGRMGMIWAAPPPTATVANAMTDSAADRSSKPVVTSSLGRAPRTRPNKPAMAEPIRGRKTIAAYISALHQIDVLNRDGAAVAEINDQDGQADGRFGGRHSQNEQ